MSLPRYISVLALAVAAPVEAQTAADAYYDPEAMAAARDALYSGHGDKTKCLALLDRFECPHPETSCGGVLAM